MCTLRLPPLLVLAAAIATTIAGGCRAHEPTRAPAPAASPQPTAAPPQAPQPPALRAPGPVRVPLVSEFALDNGLSVYVVEHHEVPLVTAQLVIRAGRMDDPLTAELTAAMLGTGTRARSQAKIEEAIDFVGGSLDSAVGTHATWFSARTLKPNLKLGLTLLADLVVNPLFAPDAFEPTKAALRATLDATRTDPRARARQLFRNLAYPPGHPYGRLPPTPDDVERVSTADLKAFHETFYRANNAFVVLAGDITVDEARPLIDRTLGRWTSTSQRELPPNPLNGFARYDLPDQLTVHVVDQPRAATTEILVGNLALARHHAEWPRLRVASSVLGAVLEDALEPQTDPDLAPDGSPRAIVAGLSPGQAPGTAFVSTRTRTANTGAALAEVLGQLKRMRTAPPEAVDVARATARLGGAFVRSIETSEQLASKLRERLIYNLPTREWLTDRDQLASVTPDHVQTSARKYMHPVPHIVLVGGAETIRDQVRAVLPQAAVKVYGADLRLLSP